MAFTSHGYHIAGTQHWNPPNLKKHCGGPEFCADCSKESLEFLVSGAKVDTKIMIDEDVRYVDQAMRHVREYVTENYRPSVKNKVFAVYVVWFSKTLQNWKALVATDLGDNRYYEVTHNGNKSETYLDAYTKIDNVVIPD
jgi:hypothetical protein